jgi:hypothetical protein
MADNVDLANDAIIAATPSSKATSYQQHILAFHDEKGVVHIETHIGFDVTNRKVQLGIFGYPKLYALAHFGDKGYEIESECGELRAALELHLSDKP